LIYRDWRVGDGRATQFKFMPGLRLRGGLWHSKETVMRTCILAAVVVMTTTGAGLAQDVEAGQGVFKRMCLPCHDAGPGAKVKLGPPLNGLDGRTAGTFAGFNYSEANKTSGITWNEQTFAEYVKNPMQRMPGTRMAFAGIRDEKDIAGLWVYLKQFNENGDKK
jgi:cytochrome c